MSRPSGLFPPIPAGGQIIAKEVRKERCYPSPFETRKTAGIRGGRGEEKGGFSSLGPDLQDNTAGKITAEIIHLALIYECENPF